MRNKIYAGIALGLGLCSCSTEKKDSSDAVEVINYASLVVEASNAEESGSLNLTSANCSNNPDTGLFQGVLTGANGSQLSLRIKGFSTAGESYTCTQASDNYGSSDIGNKFDSCFVELIIPDSSAATNTYAMHRNSIDVKDFTYDGTCSLTLTYEAPRVSGTIVCSDLVQTHYQGTLRNPIDESVTASIATGSSFFCDI